MGRKRKARVCFDRAIAEAETLGAQYDQARALHDSWVAFPELTDRRDQALILLDEIEAVIPEAERLAVQSLHSN